MKKNKGNIQDDLIEDFALPKYIKGKSFAEASEAIENKFKDRKDQYAIQTKEELLERLAEAQEYVKMQEEAEEIANMPPEMQEQLMQQQMMQEQEGMEEGMPGMEGMDEQMMQEQMMAQQQMGQGRPMDDGGDFNADNDGGNFNADNMGAAIGGASSLGTQLFDAYGTTGIDTSGQLGLQKGVSTGSMAGKGALSGAAAGATIGSVFPGLGTAIGGVVGGIAGGIGGFVKGKRQNKDIRSGNINSAYRTNSLYDNDFADGGSINLGNNNIKYPRTRFGEGAFDNLGQTLPELNYQQTPNLRNSFAGGRFAHRPMETSIGTDDHYANMLNTVVDNPEGKKGDGKFWKDAGNVALNAASFAPAAASLFNTYSRPSTERGNRLTNRYNHEPVDEQASLNAINQNNVQGAISAMSGGDAGRAMAGITAANLNKDIARSNAYNTDRQTNIQNRRAGEQFNLGVDQINLQADNAYQERKAQDEAAYESAKRADRNAIFSNIGNVSKEMLDRQTVKRMFDYRWDGTYWRNNKGDKLTDKEYKERVNEANKE